ncbi:hypothetical protein [Arenicella xantha]|uniref:Uncharacterized protein n=1 Tax=Arenicella xantha TaxID=644221 RepID=A0A395JE60_9GAMM|nr:hypothetical protein [Arenicella xantha]RBP45002.1 hypothetical protein DFR28_1202 [Arenicella xantha]
MKHISRGEFLRSTFLSVRWIIVSAAFALVTFSLLKGFTNITAYGWSAIAYITLIFLFFLIVVFLVENVVKKYKSKYGKVAQANIFALSVTFHMVVVGVSSGLAVRAFYRGGLESLGLWLVLLPIYFYHVFREFRLREMNG